MIKRFLSVAAFLALGCGLSFAQTTITKSLSIQDGSTPSQKAAVSAGGAVKVDNSGVTQPVSQSGVWVVGQSGSWSVGQSGNWTFRLQGNAGAILDFAGQNAAAPANAILMGGEFNTSPTTITSGNASPLQLDNQGNLKVNIASGSSGNGAASATGSAVPAQGDYQAVNVGGTLRGRTGSNPSGVVYSAATDVTSVAGATVSTAASGVQKVGVVGNAGAALDAAGQNASSPANELLIAGQFNTSPTAITSGNISPFQLDTNGNLKVNIVAGSSGNGAASATGSAVPAQGDYLALNVAGTLRGQTGVNPSGSVFAAQEDITSVAGATVVTAASGVQKVGVVGNAGASMDAAIAGAAAPTDSLVQGGVYNNATPIAPTDGQAAAVQIDQAGNQRVAPGVALKTLSAQGTALNSTQTIFSNSGAAAVSVQLTQTTTLTAGAVTFEVTYDGANWLAMPAANVIDPTSSTYAQIPLPYTVQASTNKQFLLLPDGATGMRIRTSTLITGTGAVTPNYALLSYSPIQYQLALSPTQANFNVTAFSPTASNFNVTVGGSLPTGGNTIGAVTQASGPWTENQTQINGVAVSTSASGVQKVGVVGNAGAVFDAAGQNAASPANEILMGGQFNTSPTAITSGNMSPLQLDSGGDLLAKINVALPTGGNTIGAVTQASGPWTENVTQINSAAVSTAASGVQKVGVVGNAGASLDAAIAGATAPTDAVAVGGIFNDATPIAPTDGQSAAEQIDQAGDQRTFFGAPRKTTAAQGTSLNSTTTIYTNSGANSVLVQLTQTTTITAGAVTFEVSYDGANWLGMAANQVLDPTSSTYAQIPIPYTCQASTNKQFLLLTNGAQGVRIRTSTAITGTGSVTPNYVLQSWMPAQPVVALSPTAANFNNTNGPSENMIGFVSGKATTVSANFTRPADTNVYASGDLVANSTTAASVVPMSFTVSRINDGSGMIRRIILKKSGTTATLATFRLHLYRADPSLSSGILNGDNGAWSTNFSNWLGDVDLDMTSTSNGRAFRDSDVAEATPTVGSELNFIPSAGTQTIYGLLEARAAYVPASAEVFTVYLEVLQN